MFGYSSNPKPKNNGLNLVIDIGMPSRLFEDYVNTFSHLIDGVKFGWGSGLVSPNIDFKIDLLQKQAIPFWFGGTLFEIAFNQKKLDKYILWVKSKSATVFEVSDGIIEIPTSDRIKIVEELSTEFEVYCEVGRKSPATPLSPSIWIEYIEGDIAAGASKVILEGRESGRAGMYRPNFEVRVGLIDDIDFSGIDLNKLVFEAPNKDQQVWFVKRFGRQCNLGNIPFSSILNVETLRRGLRGDTTGG